MNSKAESSATTYIFVRHAECLKNKHGIVGGPGTGLTEPGRLQVATLSAKLAGTANLRDLSVCYSPIQQARETATILGSALDVEVVGLTGFTPAGMGVATGRSSSELSRMFPDVAQRFARWRRREIEAWQLAVPGMEEPSRFWERSRSSIEDLANGGTRVIVTSRSVMVFACNFVAGNLPTPGGGYIHFDVENCAMLSFDTMPENPSLPFLRQELTTISDPAVFRGVDRELDCLD